MNASTIKVESGTFTWNDGLHNGGRTPRLWFVTRDGNVVRFTGASMPRVCTVLREQYQKNGKWSNTTYTIQVGTAVPVQLLAPLHGKIWNDPTWEATEAAFQEITRTAVNWDSFRAAVREQYPETAARLDAAGTLPDLD